MRKAVDYSAALSECSLRIVMMRLFRLRFCAFAIFSRLAFNSFGIVSIVRVFLFEIVPPMLSPPKQRLSRWCHAVKLVLSNTLQADISMI